MSMHLAKVGMLALNGIKIGQDANSLCQCKHFWGSHIAASEFAAGEEPKEGVITCPHCGKACQTVFRLRQPGEPHLL